MGRGRFEHNYQALDLPELRATTLDTAPVLLDLPHEASG
jgi:hypothetical protein